MRKKYFIIFIMTAIVVLAAAATCSAAGSDYTYKVHVYTGNAGQFKDGSREKTFTLKPGENMPEINLSDITVTDKKYYARGFRIAGHDNDEVTGFTGLNHQAGTDASYEVAYGIKGSLVSYTVNYIDSNGKKLRSSDRYYGMPGDKPVVSYRYIDRYEADHAYVAKTLSKNEKDNVINLTYSAVSRSGSGSSGGNANTESGQNGGAGAGTGAGGNGGANAGTQTTAAAPGTAGNPAGTNVQDNTTTNIDDNETPLASGNTEDLKDNETPLASGDQYKDLDDDKGKEKIWKIVIPVIIAAAAAAVIALLFRRRKKA